MNKGYSVRARSREILGLYCDLIINYLATCYLIKSRLPRRRSSSLSLSLRRVTSTFVPSGPAFAFASVAWQTIEEDVDHPRRPRCAVVPSRFISVKVERFILKQHHGTFDETRVKPVKRLEAMGSPDVDEVEANRPCMIPAADAGRLRCLFFALHVSVPHWSVPHKLHEDVPLLYYSPI
jgi:hypothetical protein